ncbi:hypothetical protein N0B31_09840 [Salinirubellus salinus]|uniref:DUF2892 domain-containing protein n=1 Tax=Salinirubellus salinus TaxID=1364945 RepID=A0A9E7R6W4_9EURY|nr:hypothetical protein [Salinirubellus salinus]UWM56576.1 hypothetical protein N0B31_09840 [Salinirubellus salinus]
MALTDTPEERNRIVQIVLAGIVGLAAVRAYRRGNRVGGVLGALGAVALGYTALSDSEREAATVEVDDVRAPASADASTEPATESEPAAETATVAEAKLRCAACGEPIVPGQRRGPDEHDRTVHEACLQAAA